MSGAQSISQPLTGEQVKQRLSVAVSADVSALINAADAAAARVALSAQEQNDGLDYLSGLSNLDEPPEIAGRETLLTDSGWKALNYQEAELTADHVWLGASAPGAPPVEFETGAKGRDLLAIETAAALQTEIVARLEGATIAPAIINATGKISTTSTADDSIETAGGVTSSLLISGPGSAPTTVAGYHQTNKGNLASATSLNPGIQLLPSVSAPYGMDLGHDGTTFATRIYAPQNRRIILAGATTNPEEQADFVPWVTVTPTTAAAAAFGQTNMGNGRIDTAERIVSRSTAADAIISSGGYRADAAGAYHFGIPTDNDSWRITRSGTDLVIQRRESGSWVTKSTIAA